MQAIWNGQVIAEAGQGELIRIEGNWYFPSSTVNKDLLTSSNTHTNCHWKGEASYYNVKVNEEINQDAAWYYPQPKDGSIKRVGKDFTNYIAFWHGVEIK